MGLTRSGHIAAEQINSIASALTPTFIRVGIYQYYPDTTETYNLGVGRGSYVYQLWKNSRGGILYTLIRFINASVRRQNDYNTCVGTQIWNKPDGATRPVLTGQVVEYMGYKPLTVQADPDVDETEE